MQKQKSLEYNQVFEEAKSEYSQNEIKEELSEIGPKGRSYNDLETEKILSIAAHELSEWDEVPGSEKVREEGNYIGQMFERNGWWQFALWSFGEGVEASRNDKEAQRYTFRGLEWRENRAPTNTEYNNAPNSQEHPPYVTPGRKGKRISPEEENEIVEQLDQYETAQPILEDSKYSDADVEVVLKEAGYKRWMNDANIPRNLKEELEKNS